jgi:hypothetical protein
MLIFFFLFSSANFWYVLPLNLFAQRQRSWPNWFIKAYVFVERLVWQILILAEIFEYSNSLWHWIAPGWHKKTEILLEDLSPKHFPLLLKLLSIIKESFWESDTWWGKEVTAIFSVEGRISTYSVLCNHPVNSLNTWLLAWNLKHKPAVNVD